MRFFLDVVRKIRKSCGDDDEGSVEEAVTKKASAAGDRIKRDRSKRKWWKAAMDPKFD